jgi:hypothetical protein
MLGKLLGFDHMHENKKHFLFFHFIKEEINLRILRFFNLKK